MKILRFLTCLATLGLFGTSSGWTQTIVFDKTDITVSPGDTFTLQISGNTGSEDISAFSLFLNVSIVDASPSPFSVSFASLGPLWVYSGGSPSVPQVIPYVPVNSQDYGNAFSTSPSLAPGTYLLTTLTIKVSETAGFSLTPYTLASTLSSVFLDSGFDTYTPAAAQLNITVIPEPATCALLGLGLTGLLFRRRRR